MLRKPKLSYFGKNCLNIIIGGNIGGNIGLQYSLGGFSDVSNASYTHLCLKVQSVLSGKYVILSNDIK